MLVNLFTSISEFITTYLNLILVAFFGFFVAMIIMLWRYRGLNPSQCRQTLKDNHQQIQKLQSELNQLQTNYQKASTHIAVITERSSRLSQLESSLTDMEQQLSQANQKIQHEIAERIQAQEKMRYLSEIEEQLKLQKQYELKLNTELADLKSSEAQLNTLLKEERKQTEEKMELLKQSEQQLSQRFENLANKILDEKTKIFTEQNQSNISNLLTPLKDQLGEFKTRVETIHLHDSKDRSSLRAELSNLKLQTQRMNEEAVNLTRALKGDNKVQGNWGEMVLERVLEQSGLRQGSEYNVQRGYRDDDNKIKKPDVIIHLPEKKDIVIDSKVSLIAYDAYCSAEDDKQQATLLNKHVESVRKHIQDLSKKDYSSLKGLRSLDFVLLFIPIEAAFMIAFQCDEQLFSDAFEHKIIVVTPTTLLATLRTIENIWRFERQNENARSIADKAGALHDKLCGFLEDMEKIGLQIDTMQRTYDAAMNKLSSGRGNLIRQADTLVQLGAKTKKNLPRNLLSNSDQDQDGGTTGS